MTSAQIAVIRALAEKLKPQHLIRCGVTMRKSEAELFIETLKEVSK